MTVEEHKKHEEAAIKRLIEGFVEALRTRDLDGVMTMYAPEIVTFDLVPPLHYVGADAMRKRWQEVFSSLLQGPFGYEVADLDITVGDEMAFTHSFNRSSTTLPTGQQIGTWMRWTACWRKIGGRWLIVHDQVSVPVDVQTGKAMLDLSP